MTSSRYTTRNLIAFWILGLCTNYTNVIMLSAAKDILKREEGSISLFDNSTTPEFCEERISSRNCTTISTGAVLLADILPALVIKLFAPFFMYHIPFGIRHLVVVICQSTSFLVVALSSSVKMSLLGCVFASTGTGLGEMSYLALAAYFPKNAISTWSSGKGGAGIIAALSYAFLTEPHFLNLTPRTTLLIMLIVPFLFAVNFWCILVLPASVHQITICNPKTWLVPRLESSSTKSNTLVLNGNAKDADVYDHDSAKSPDVGKLGQVLPLMKYMVPLCCVYFGQYFINQGLVELIFFDCSSGMYLARTSQYRWYQVLYQLGYFISISSVNFIQIAVRLLPLLAILQLLNATLFFFDVLYFYIPHIAIVFGIILFEGLLGGGTYVNAFHNIHQSVEERHKEFSLGLASVANALGVVIAGFSAIPAHNFLCLQPFPKN